jgi:hypothetical protein
MFNILTKTIMENENKDSERSVSRWWNPLVYVYAIIAPLAGAVLCAVAGLFVGAVLGYEEGLRRSCNKMEEVINQLP